MANSATSPPISFFSSSIFLTTTSTHQNPKTLFSTFKPISLKPLFHCPNHTSPIRSELATLPILSFDGSKIGETTLNLKSAPPETSRAVVHRGIITDLQNKRRGTASTLTRGEVRGGGIKPYPQKKTGRARRGSQRTPLRPGGGVVFGPKPRDWTIKINRKEKRLAISTAISSAAVNTVVVEEFGDRFEKPKTKEFIALMQRWGIDPKEKSLFLMTEVSENVKLSSRNIGTLKMLTPRTLNLFDVLNSDKLVFTQAAVDYLNEIYGYDYDGETEVGYEDYEEEEEEQEQEQEQEKEGSEGCAWIKKIPIGRPDGRLDAFKSPHYFFIPPFCPGNLIRLLNGFSNPIGVPILPLISQPNMLCVGCAANLIHPSHSSR